MYKYLKIWWIFLVRTTQIAFESRLGVVIFTIGKVLRYGLYIFFLYVIVAQTKTMAGYSLWEILLFLATFNFIDTTAQFFFREVYRFRRHVISGYLDYTLLWPLSPLFKGLFGGSDVLDIPLIFLSIVFIVVAFGHLPITASGVVMYIIFVCNALAIALAFHIFVLGFGILTTEIDNILWMYRDLTHMGRIPIDVYYEPLRSIITFAIPVGIMMTFPVKSLLGMLSPTAIIAAFAISITSIVLSIIFWRYALKQYASASS